MNRLIKFRGKRKDTGEWIFGALINILSDATCIVRYDGSLHKVNPNTVGQFTGLYNKTGTPIYEGDVLQVNPTIYGRGYVIWHDRMAQFVVQMVDSDQWYNIPNGVVEVCGNVHDNPELLKYSK